MKCPECVAQGLRSAVWIKDEEYGTLNESGEREVLISKKYWDEDGIWHCHDINPFIKIYECDNGHIWDISHYAKCMVPNCFWDPPHVTTWDPTQEPKNKMKEKDNV
jgi:hypothetical protein